MSKISIWLSTHNNNTLLSNTLYSLSKQETTFPLEVCIIDDHSDIDPKPIVDKFLPNAKYKRLPERSGFNFAQSYCFGLADPDADIIILQSADIIYTKNYIIDEICDSVNDKIAITGEVVDINIPNDFYLNFDENIKKYLSNWNSFIGRRKCQILDTIYYVFTRYTGLDLNSWLFFAGAILRKDLESMGYGEGTNICDAVMNNKMREYGMMMKIQPSLKIIHQRHPKYVYNCSVLDSCKYNCIRKDKTYKRIIDAKNSDLNANL